jgi:hypothetical protein
MATNPSDDETTPRCPWCGERNLPTRSAQIEPLGDDRWLCNTCSKVFRARQEPPKSGDDGHVVSGTLQQPTVTEEDLREVGREAFGIVYPGDPPKPKRKPLPITLTAQFDEQIRARRSSR